MKRTFILIATLATIATAEEPKLRLEFQRTSPAAQCTLRLSWNAKANTVYQVVRYDLNNQYYDVVTNLTTTASGQISVVINPMLPSDEDQPAPSGQCHFKLVEINK